jgi:hypothetical protein
MNEEEYSAYLVTSSLSAGVNAIVTREFRDIFKDRYTLWPGLEQQTYLDRFMKAVRDFNYHFTMGDADTGSKGYEPRFLGFDAKAQVTPPPESSFSYRGKSDADANPNDPGVIQVSQDDWLIPKTQAQKFIDKTLQFEKLPLKGLDKSSLSALAPLRPFSFNASLSVLGDDKDRIMKEWHETTAVVKLFTITLAPQSK